MESSFYERLREVLFVRKINTQKELSLLTGIDNGTISRWKNEKITPSDGSLLRLSDILECNFEYLKTGQGQPFPTVEHQTIITESQLTQSLIEVSGNQGTELNFTHNINQKSPQSGTVALELSGKEYRVIIALRKIGKEEYTDELLRRVEAAAKALTW